MTMKKKILTTLSVVLILGLAALGILAYLMDEDSDVNVMTLGNVSIEQHEYQRVENADGTYETDTIDNVRSYVLEDFEQGKALLPSAINTTTWEGWDWDDTIVRMTQVDSYGGMQVFKEASNAQDKFVVVENTGKTDAYVRTLVAIEVGDGNAALIGKSYHSTWSSNEVGTVTIDGNNYYVYEYVYAGGQLSDGSWRHGNGILPAGDTAYPNLSQVYIKSEATNEDMVAIDGNGNGLLDILVLSQAVQVEGFDTAADALTAGFGEANAVNVKAWFEGTNAPVSVDSESEMKAAVDAGEKDIYVQGVEFKNSLPLKSDVNVIFVDCVIKGGNSWKYVNNATFQNCTFDAGSENAAIHFDRLYGELVVNDCTFKSGKVQIGTDGSSTAKFNNCVFGETATTSIWAEKGMRFYCPTTFNNCEFNNRVVLAGSNGLSLTFDGCTMNGGTPVYYVDNTDGIIRGGNVPAVTIK